ncbi:MAG: phosphopantetheine-binding protein [bacterium]|jgi:acyl carrier protein
MSIEEQIEDLKVKIIAALDLEDVTPGDIDPDAPLFQEGLGLDSIDALELVVMLEKEYKISVKDMEVTKKAFASVRALALFVTEHQHP